MTTVLPLPLSYVGETGRQILFPTLLLDGAQAVLVDCGYPGSLPLLEAPLRPLGLRAADLTGVFLTHHDDDHVGGLAQLKRAVPHLPVMTGAEEAPYLSGARKSLRLGPRGLRCRRLGIVPPEPDHPGGGGGRAAPGLREHRSRRLSGSAVCP